MRSFMSEDFLLSNTTAIELFEGVKDLPIIDYHCHIEAKDIYENRKFNTITEAWLGGDHYKWRAMRNYGIEEKYITGNAEDYDKFVAWATVLAKMPGNPLYHFSHLELKRYLGIDTPLSPATAKEIYTRANEVLAELPVREIIKKAKVETIVTTNTASERLRFHKLLKEENYPVKVLPGFRPDMALNLEKNHYGEYIDHLSERAGCQIKDYDDLKKALRMRLDFFESMGCRASDHGLDYIPYNISSSYRSREYFSKALDNKALTVEEIDGFKTDIMQFLAKEYTERGMVMELHFGCSRNVNKDMYLKLGADTGFDCISHSTRSDNLYGFLNELNFRKQLPKTLLFSLNPSDNEQLVTVMGAFSRAPYKGMVQQGSAWWFNDNKLGIEKQLATYAAGAPIDTFVGMLTDSRSFLSYGRHEYFRRILCNFLGTLVESGEYPADIATLQEIATNVCYANAKEYFGF